MRIGGIQNILYHHTLASSAWELSFMRCDSSYRGLGTVDFSFHPAAFLMPLEHVFPVTNDSPDKVGIRTA